MKPIALEEYYVQFFALSPSAPTYVLYPGMLETIDLAGELGWPAYTEDWEPGDDETEADAMNYLTSLGMFLVEDGEVLNP